MMRKNKMLRKYVPSVLLFLRQWQSHYGLQRITCFIC